jgi:hypothetical protein
MKHWLAIGAAVALTGCGDAANAPAEYVKTGLAAKEHAREVGDDWTADRELQAFRVKQGRDPESLAELEASEGKLKAPRGKHWAYEPAGAKLSLLDD